MFMLVILLALTDCGSHQRRNSSEDVGLINERARISMGLHQFLIEIDPISVRPRASWPPDDSPLRGIVGPNG
jgi:hypothetical protein